MKCTLLELEFNVKMAVGDCLHALKNSMIRTKTTWPHHENGGEEN